MIIKAWEYILYRVCSIVCLQRFIIFVLIAAAGGSVSAQVVDKNLLYEGPMLMELPRHGVSFRLLEAWRGQIEAEDYFVMQRPDRRVSVVLIPIEGGQPELAAFFSRAIDLPSRHTLVPHDHIQLTDEQVFERFSVVGGVQSLLAQGVGVVGNQGYSVALLVLYEPHLKDLEQDVLGPVASSIGFRTPLKWGQRVADTQFWPGFLAAKRLLAQRKDHLVNMPAELILCSNQAAYFRRSLNPTESYRHGVWEWSRESGGAALLVRAADGNVRRFTLKLAETTNGLYLDQTSYDLETYWCKN